MTKMRQNESNESSQSGQSYLLQTLTNDKEIKITLEMSFNSFNDGHVDCRMKHKFRKLSFEDIIQISKI